MQKTFGQYNLTTALAQKYSHSTYLASVTDDPQIPKGHTGGHSEPERQVVLTTFAPSLCRLPHERESLLKKAQCIKDLQHEHLALILDMGVEQEQFFVVREYWPNGSLRSRLKAVFPGRLELEEALTVVLQVGQALVYAHERGTVHGNIKPENILLDDSGQAILTDFSLVGRKDAIIRDQTSEEYAFCYMAPEQFAGITDARSDQYSLGCLAYELITGRVPFAAQSLASMMGYQSDRVPDPLSRSVTDLPSSLEVAVLKTLAKDPDERFLDFSLFLDVIQSALSPPPAFPLLRSTHSSKKGATSHSVQLAKAETISSPIRKRAAKREASQIPELSRFPWSAEAETISSSIRKRASKGEVSQTPELSETLWSTDAEKVAELAVTTPITAGDSDNGWLFEPLVEEEEDGLLVRAAASSAGGQSEATTNKMAFSLTKSAGKLGSMALLAQLSRRRVVELGLLLSVIVTVVCCALWFSGIVSFGRNSSLSNSASDNSRANLRIIPTSIVLQAPKIQPLVIPTVIPDTSFRQNAALASFKPNTENSSLNSNAGNSNPSLNSTNNSTTPTPTGVRVRSSGCRH